MFSSPQLPNVEAEAECSSARAGRVRGGFRPLALPALAAALHAGAASRKVGGKTVRGIGARIVHEDAPPV